VDSQADWANSSEKPVGAAEAVASLVSVRAQMPWIAMAIGAEAVVEVETAADYKQLEADCTAGLCEDRRMATTAWMECMIGSLAVGEEGKQVAFGHFLVFAHECSCWASLMGVLDCNLYSRAGNDRTAVQRMAAELPDPRCSENEQDDACSHCLADDTLSLLAQGQ